jgi:acetylornithine/succinyldiaminopimelate/putrescine aminotransferase
LPPLVIEREDLDRVIEAIAGVLQEYFASREGTE